MRCKGKSVGDFERWEMGWRFYGRGKKVSMIVGGRCGGLVKEKGGWICAVERKMGLMLRRRDTTIFREDVSRTPIN